MAEEAVGSSNSRTTTTVLAREEKTQNNQLILRLRSSPRQYPRVSFASDVIDNEHLGRLKSNCCCIYTRPRMWDDPSTWEQNEHETEHCRGHTLPPSIEKKDEKDKNCC